MSAPLTDCGQFPCVEESELSAGQVQSRSSRETLLAVSFLDRVRGWWNKDKLERADEGTHMSAEEREHTEEDYEAGKDEVFLREHLGTEGVDFERDSEPPTHP
jgi:hypothetical protein